MELFAPAMKNLTLYFGNSNATEKKRGRLPVFSVQRRGIIIEAPQRQRTSGQSVVVAGSR